MIFSLFFFFYFFPIATRLTRLALFQGVQTESQLRMWPRHALQAEDQPCQVLWLEALNDYCKPLNIIICISPPPNVLHVQHVYLFAQSFKRLNKQPCLLKREGNGLPWLSQWMRLLSKMTRRCQCGEGKCLQISLGKNLFARSGNYVVISKGNFTYI